MENPEEGDEQTTQPNQQTTQSEQQTTQKQQQTTQSEQQTTEKQQQTTDSATSNGTSSDTPKLNGTGLKSILKVKTEPLLTKVESESLPEFETLPTPSPDTTENKNLVSTIYKPPRKKVHGLKTTTTLSYENPAFEIDGSGNGEAGGKERRLASVVDKVVVKLHDAHDWHPFGRASMYEEMVTGKHRNGIFESEKIILWFIFTIILVGMAGGIIFLSETYSVSNQSLFGNSTI